MRPVHCNEKLRYQNKRATNETNLWVNLLQKHNDARYLHGRQIESADTQLELTGVGSRRPQGAAQFHVSVVCLDKRVQTDHDCNGHDKLQTWQCF